MEACSLSVVVIPVRAYYHSLWSSVLFWCTSGLVGAASRSCRRSRHSARNTEPLAMAAVVARQQGRDDPVLLPHQDRAGAVGGCSARTRGAIPEPCMTSSSFVKLSVTPWHWQHHDDLRLGVCRGGPPPSPTREHACQEGAPRVFPECVQLKHWLPST